MGVVITDISDVLCAPVGGVATFLNESANGTVTGSPAPATFTGDAASLLGGAWSVVALVMGVAVSGAVLGL